MFHGLELAFCVPPVVVFLVIFAIIGNQCVFVRTQILAALKPGEFLVDTPRRVGLVYITDFLCGSERIRRIRTHFEQKMATLQEYRLCWFECRIILNRNIEFNFLLRGTTLEIESARRNDTQGTSAQK